MVVELQAASVVREVDLALADVFGAETFEEALRIIAEQARFLIGAHQAALSYIPDGNFNAAVHAIALSDKYAGYRTYDVMPTGLGIWALVSEQKSSFCMTQEQLTSHPRWKNFSDLKDARGLEHPPMRGWLAVPVLTRPGEVIGFLQLSDKYDGDFTQRDLDLLTRLAKLVAPTLELQLVNTELQEITASLADQRGDALKVAQRAQDAQTQAEQVEERLNLALKSAGAGTWVWNIVEDSITWDDFIHALFGMAPGTFHGRFEDVLPLVHPADREVLRREVTRSVDTNAPFACEFRVIWPDGSVHALGARGKVYRDRAGQPLRMTGVCWDVSERRRADEALQQSQAELARSNESLERANADLRQAQTTLSGIASRLALPDDTVAQRPYRLDAFSLTDMMNCGGVLRGMAKAGTKLRFSQALVRYLYDHMLDSAGNRALALVRLFETRRLDELDGELRDIAKTTFPDAVSETICLTLVATAGEQAEWNDSQHSSEHRVIPLPSEEAVERLPMIAQIIWQFGLEISGVLKPEREMLVGRPDAGVFHVPEALGSPFIPAQSGFVIPYGIRSVIAFGDLLPDGRLFAVILFSKVPVSREVAALFGYLSLSTRMAMLTYIDIADKTTAQILSLDRLLRNHEQIVADQDQRVRVVLSDLARSNADLEQFAYVASHDLQEPLRAVTGYCQLLSQRYGDQLDSQAQGFIHHIVEGGSRMQSLIEGLLEYSRVGSRGRPPDAIDVGQVVATALDNLRTAIQETGAVVECGPLPRVMVDREQWVRLFQNLIGNALKYRGKAAPKIQVSANNTGPEWVFSIRDNGIGFDSKYAKRIFMIFQRLHTRREYPGTGIGLALCERIVQRHGGRIWAESTPGRGSTFIFTLPHNGGACA